jgi:hypothetical protein
MKLRLLFSFLSCLCKYSVVPVVPVVPVRKHSLKGTVPNRLVGTE